MKTILIVCVNYNSYEHLANYLDSIETAKMNCPDCIVDVCIADNSTQKQELIIDKYHHINIKAFLFENLGYLGGASAIINNEIKEILIYDFIIVSNVDILVSEKFFIELLGTRFDNNIAWIAPQIYSEKEKRDRNPKIRSRLSTTKISMIRTFYRFPLLFEIYNKTFYHRKSKRKIITQSEIYAGHGSFILLTKVFFQHYEKISYPIFLFGEEIFFAELIKKVNLKVLHSPNIKIIDLEHASTSKMSSKSYCKENFNAVKYLMETFYEQN